MPEDKYWCEMCGKWVAENDALLLDDTVYVCPECEAILEVPDDA